MHQNYFGTARQWTGIKQMIKAILVILGAAVIGIASYLLLRKDKEWIYNVKKRAEALF